MRGSGGAVIHEVWAAAVCHPLQIPRKVIKLVSGRFGSTLLIFWSIKALAFLRWGFIARQAAGFVSVRAAFFILGLIR